MGRGLLFEISCGCRGRRVSDRGRVGDGRVGYWSRVASWIGGLLRAMRFNTVYALSWDLRSQKGKDLHTLTQAGADIALAVMF
jgi:hypothetical protein